MPVLLLERDPFLEDNATLAISDRLGSNVRRPIDGLVPKANSWASIGIVQADPDGNSGQPISILDSSAPGGFSNANHNFCVQRVSYQLTEKAQIVETFGDHYIFFYGKKPTVLSVAGYLMNTQDFGWKQEWISNWNEYLRGTKCVRRRARVILTYDEQIMEGYMLSTNIDQSADVPYLCPFGFQMVVTNIADISTPLVTSAEEARQYTTAAFTGTRSDITGQGIGNYSEYHQPPREDDIYTYDDVSGETTVQVAGSRTGINGTPAYAGGALSPDTASWATNPRAVRRQWDTPQEAQLALDRAIVRSQNTSRATKTAVANGRSGFPLSTRSAAHDQLSNALGAAMAGASLVIPDIVEVG